MTSYVLKWGKESYQVTIDSTTTPTSLMTQVEQLTCVKIANQKILSKKGWKGVLSSTTKLKVKPGKTTLSLMGSVDSTLKETTSTNTSITFAEDITPEEKMQFEKEQLDAALIDAEGNIPSVQLNPINNARQDGKAISYKYNYFVTGLPQQRIEFLLKQQRESNNNTLIGESIMTCGAELGKAFTTSVAVFPNGTLLSARDDGRIQLWRHGERINEMNQGDPKYPSPVTCVAVLGNFIGTGGSGVIKLWNDQGECMQAMRAPEGTNARSIVAISVGDPQDLSFAVSFTQARPFDPNEFRLEPQNEAQEQRRAVALENRRRQQERFEHIARGISVITPHGNQTLYPWENRIMDIVAGHPPVYDLAFEQTRKTVWVGDAEGSLRGWKYQGNRTWKRDELIQLTVSGSDENGTNSSIGVSIIRIEPLDVKHHQGIFAVSVAQFSREQFSHLPPGRITPGQSDILTFPMPLDVQGCVVLVNVAKKTVQMVLNGHTDLVAVLRSLPNGDLLTAGGKKDATLKVWKKSMLGSCDSDSTSIEERQLQRALLLSQGIDVSSEENSSSIISLPGNSAQVLDEPGYVFDVCVLPDLQEGSELFCLGCARYNVVKVCL